MRVLTNWTGLLQHLTSPHSSENLETHAKFCTYTSSLLEVLFGVSTDRTSSEPSLLNKMTKVDIVSKTPITFNKDELFHLLHSTLLEYVYNIVQHRYASKMC